MVTAMYCQRSFYQLCLCKHKTAQPHLAEPAAQVNLHDKRNQALLGGAAACVSYDKRTVETYIIVECA